jgi:hypothetical protein
MARRINMPAYLRLILLFALGCQALSPANAQILTTNFGTNRSSLYHRETAQERYDRVMNDLTNAVSEEDRSFEIGRAAKASFDVGKIDDARKYAQKLMTLLQKYQTTKTNCDCDIGDAIQDVNIVFGRIALREGRVEDAKHYLIEAGKSPGSPVMDSFGPNMSLAKDLLEKGERDVVLEYFGLCRKFWSFHNDKLDEWSQDVKAGKIPKFGANLVY